MPRTARLWGSPDELRSADRLLIDMVVARRLVVHGAVILTTVVAVTGCSSVSDGPVVSICGVNIGQAEVGPGSGPFYIDASVSAPSAPVTAASGANPVNVRVSPNCSTGAQVSVSDNSVIKSRARSEPPTVRTRSFPSTRSPSAAPPSPSDVLVPGRQAWPSGWDLRSKGGRVG